MRDFLTRVTDGGRSLWLRPAMALGLLLALAVPAQALVTRLVARQATPRLTALPHEVLPGLSRLHDLGPLPTGQRVLVAITLKQDLNSLYRAEWNFYNPSSPSYHRFLTPAEFRTRFAPPASEVNAVRSFGTAHGLQLVNRSVLYNYVELWGTAAQVEATFHVRLDRFRNSRGQAFFANLTAPQVPAGLGIDGLLGLESLDRYHLADSPSGSSSPSQGGCNADPTGTVSGCTGLLSPQALWKAYGTPGAGQTTPDTTSDFGQGQSIGIIGEGQTLDVITALRQFEKTRSLPFVPVQVYHTDPGENAAENTLDDSGRIEWEMDTQASSGMAPEISQLRLYFGSSLALTELTGALDTWVNDPSGPLQASASLGACEDTPATDPLFGASQRADQALLIQAAMEGRTLFASSGDVGAGCSVAVSENGIQYGPIPVPEYPAVDPNAAAVGGTVLYTQPNGSRQIERAWDHTGGGPSKFLPQMPWQTKAAAPFLESNVCPGVYADGSSFPQGSGNLCRGSVDISAESGDATISADHKAGDAYLAGGYDPTAQPVQPNGFDMVDFCPDSEVASENPAQASCAYDANGGTEDKTTTDGASESGVMTNNFSEGGTSLSSPLWVGMWALIQAHHDAGNTAAGSLGLATPLIYKLGSDATTDARDFYDVTVGSNGLPAAPGWDYPTGWGSPNVAALTEDASGTPGSTVPASDVQPGSSDPTPLVAQLPAGPSCSYSLYDPKADAPDPVMGSQDDQLDLVQGTLGLTPDHTKLRVVMNIKNLSKALPTGATTNDYEFFWTNPKGDSGPDAVDVQVSSSGTVTYADGTETATTAGGSTSYSFTASTTSKATGTFGSGPGGAIEVDVPLSELGLKAGQTLTGPSAYTAADYPGLGFIVDQDGPGNNYTVGQPTCVDPETSGGGRPQQVKLSVTLSGSGHGRVTGSGISCTTGTCSAAYNPGTRVRLTAVPASGSSFAGWTGSGCSGTAPCTVTMSANRAVGARFNAKPPPATRVTVVGTPTSNGRGVVVKLRCTAPAGHRCQTTETLTTVETVRNGRVVAVSASGKGSHRRTVVVGTARANLTQGSTSTLVVSLNSTGRSLLKQFHKLPVTLAVGLIQNGRTATVARRTVTITPTTHRK